MLPLTSYIARQVQALRKKLKSAIMKYDIPLIIRGHDASISKGSIKAVVRWVQDSHTSAMSQATKSYCGLRTKSCPSSCANLKSGMKIEHFSDRKPTKTTVPSELGGTWWQAQQRWSCTQGSTLTGESGDQHRLWGGERADSRGIECLPTLPVCDCRRSIQLLSG